MLLIKYKIKKMFPCVFIKLDIITSYIFDYYQNFNMRNAVRFAIYVGVEVKIFNKFVKQSRNANMANNLEISDEGYLINASVIAVLFIIGVTGQLICFAVLLEKFHRKRDLTPYFLNITTANSLMLLLNFPVNFASSVSHRYVLNQTGCYVLSFNAGTTGIVMITTLTFVAVTIYKQVTKKSANSHCATTSSGWRKGVAATWVYSAFLMLPPVFGWSSTALQTGQTSCAPDWRAKHPGDIIYLVLLSIFALLVPLGVSAMYFIKLYRFLARNQRENRSLSIKQRQSYEHYKNGAKMIGISMFVFFLVWTPYCTFGLTTAFSQEEVLHGTIALVPELIAKSSVIYNPIIYVLVNRR